MYIYYWCAIRVYTAFVAMFSNCADRMPVSVVQHSLLAMCIPYTVRTGPQSSVRSLHTSSHVQHLSVRSAVFWVKMALFGQIVPTTKVRAGPALYSAQHDAFLYSAPILICIDIELYIYIYIYNVRLSCTTS